MTLDRSLAGMNWENAYQTIREQTKEDMSSVLIVRGSEVATERHIQNHLTGLHRTVYVKMGTALNWFNLDKAILAQLNSVGSQEGRFENYRKIASSVLSNEPQAIDLVIIDNCHKIIDKNIFLLLGLMLELSGVVQFIFLLPEDYIQKFIKATETYKGRMFTNFLKSRYDITA